MAADFVQLPMCDMTVSQERKGVGEQERKGAMEQERKWAAEEERGEGMTMLGEPVVPGLTSGVLIGPTRVWREGRECVTEVAGLFPPGLTASLDTGQEGGGWRVALWRAASSFTMLAVGLGAKLLLKVGNTTVVHGQEHLDTALARPPGTPLVSVTNHQSCLDDPGIWGAILGPGLLANTRAMRWGASASEVIFLNRPLATFWSLGKVVPIVRGWGVHQPAMAFLLDRLDRGAWVNIFPEGRVNWPPSPIRLRWGVGRLLADCSAPPLLLPVCHRGMDRVLPNPETKGHKQAVRPRLGNLVTVCVGRPVDMAPLVNRLRAEGAGEEEVRARLTEEVQGVMDRLGEEAGARHRENIEAWLGRWHDTVDTTPSILT